MKSASVLSSTYIAGTNNEYSTFPDDYVLEKIIVVHRHGDRAQIAKELPNYPEHESVTSIWRDRLPNEKTLLNMYDVASTASSSVKQFDTDIMKELYSGFDSLAYPYAQLTEIGSQQLTAVGSHLRKRYIDTGLLKDINLDTAASSIYCRSTNICRTLQSLRSLLVGFLNVDESKKVSRDKLPIINVVPKLKEVMFPQGDGPCKPFAERRQELLTNTPISTVLGYSELEDKMKELLGYTDKVNWLTVKEILTCHAVHDIDHIKGISKEDEESVTKLAGWLWGYLYSDDHLNKLAIGRFINELLLHIDNNANDDKKVFIFSGHDSTLVPVLGVLGVLEKNWPPYSSYLTLEIAISKSTKSKYVRAIYNDKELIMSVIENNNSIWCPYDKFIDRLKAMSLTNEQYKQICDTTCESDIDKVEEDSDVKATIA